MNHLGTRGDPATRTLEEDRIIEILLVGGWAFEVRDGERQRAVEATRAALARWVEAGLPVSIRPDGARFYDPVEVNNFMRWFSIASGDPFWTERFRPTGRRFVLEQNADWLSRRGAGHAQLRTARRFSVGFRRTFNLSSIAKGSPIRLRLPLPIEDAALGDLRLDIDTQTDVPVRFDTSLGRLEARLEGPGRERLSLGYRANFTARTDTGLATTGISVGELDTDIVALYTQPNEGFIRVSPRIAALARDLAGKSSLRRDVVQSLWDYMLDHMMSGSVHYHEIGGAQPMDWLLDNRWFDCQLGSALLVSLCRAIGIPARIVSGYMLYPLAPSYHYWIEVWMDGTGWTPFDLQQSWDLSNGGRDRAWRDCFAGSVDYRMKVQCLPQIFIGPMSLRIPPRWHILTQGFPHHVRISLNDIALGQPMYSDDIEIQPGDDVSY